MYELVCLLVDVFVASAKRENDCRRCQLIERQYSEFTLELRCKAGLVNCPFPTWASSLHTVVMYSDTSACLVRFSEYFSNNIQGDQLRHGLIS